MTGTIRANFQKGDQHGSEFTFLTVVASDGMTTSEIEVTVRWAYSGELYPEFETAIREPVIVPGLDGDVAILGDPQHSEAIVTMPEFG